MHTVTEIFHHLQQSLKDYYGFQSIHPPYSMQFSLQNNAQNRCKGGRPRECAFMSARHKLKVIESQCSDKLFADKEQNEMIIIRTQLFNGPLSGTTQMSRYQKKPLPTHTHEEEEGFT